MDLTICERWKLSAPALPGAGEPWFMDWVQREPQQVSRHLTAGFYAYLSLQEVYGLGELRSAREYFGGMGAQSLMIQDGIRPMDHEVLERNLVAVAWLKGALADRPVHVYRADSYAPESARRADLVGLDFGDLTAWRLVSGQPQRALLDRVFGGAPKAVVLTDIAGPRLHLHRERYAGVLHRRPQSLINYPAYLYALDDWFRAHYGYRMVRGYYHRWSAVLALVPARLTGEGVLLPVPDSPRGLEIR